MEMKRTLVSLLSLTALFSLLTLTSCQKEQLGNGTQFRATMEGCTGQNDKTVLDGTALNWVEGDQIVVYGNAGSGLYTATPQTPATVALFDNVSGETGDGPFRAYYPSTLTTDGINITLPTTQSYVEGSIHEFPMYALSDNQVLSFKNLCGVLKLHLAKAGVNISSITVTAGSEINGTWLVNYMVYAGNDPEISVDYSSGAPMLQYVSGGTNSITLDCATAQAIDNGADFYIYLPADSYTGLQIEMNTDDGKYCVKTANTTINVVRSQYTLVSLDENDLDFVEPLPEGALPGLFTINENGDQVRFSKGNLQYQASTDTWRFAERQDRFVGDATHGNVFENGVKSNNALISNTYTGWIDLFGWGTGNNPTLHTTNYSTYSTFVDWGQNTISNGGNQSNTWRTLTKDEWDYLFNDRTNATAKYGIGNIGGVGGLIILPDSWSLPQNCTFNAGVDGPEGDWTYKTYTFAQWIEMEANGAVFLPVAGYRWGSDVSQLILSANSADGVGRYWSSTAADYDLDGFRAYQMYFVPYLIDYEWYFLAVAGSEYPDEGYAVRLVQNVN